MTKKKGPPSPVRIDDLTKSTEERWLAGWPTTSPYCGVCNQHLLPHRDGGWLHINETALPATPVTHAPVVVWKTKGATSTSKHPHF